MTPESQARLCKILKHDEGLRLQPYRDSVGVWTIGYGHNLEAKPITKAAAETIFADDLADAVYALGQALPWARNLDDVRYAVLVMMVFNLGLVGLLKFKKMLGATAVGNFDLAANEMLDSVWAGQVGKRANRLATMMRTGKWPPK